MGDQPGRKGPDGSFDTDELLIFDGESAVMGIDPDDTPVGAVVHHSTAVVRLATEFFAYYWRHGADPFAEHPPATSELTQQELEFLHLLVQGATDEQVGRKLGVSLRTVRRMAAKLSEQAGSSGRFELGFGRLSGDGSSRTGGSA